MTREKISIAVSIDAPVEKVWELYTRPQHITNWNSASEDWHTTKAENDLMVGGKFLSRMEAKDGSMGFDFTGSYDTIVVHQRIDYTIADGRKVQMEFTPESGGTHIAVDFEAEDQNPIDMQKGGWQAILDNFKKYVENLND